MLDLNPELVCTIILRAREFQAKDEVVLPDRPFDATDDWALQTLSGHLEDMSYREVADAIDDLEPDQQAQLVALMWVGRGDFDESEWDAALAEATDRATDRTAEYVLATPLASDYLLEGLELLGYSCDD